MSADALCDQVVEVVCGAEVTCCDALEAPPPLPGPDASVDAGHDAGRDAAVVATDAGVMGDGSTAMYDASFVRDSGPLTRDEACRTTQHALCTHSLGALASDPRLGYVPERGGALLASLRTRAQGCWAHPFAPSEISDLFAGTAGDAERCTPRGATVTMHDLRVASLACDGARACRLYLEGTSGEPQGQCEERAVVGDMRCSHPFDCPSGRYCDYAGEWTPGTWGDCQPFLATGWDCRDDASCASGYCASKGQCAERPESLRCLSVAYADLVLLETPSLYYRFGDRMGTTAHDSSGQGHSGTYVGTAAFQPGALGTIDDDGALTLDGTDHLQGPAVQVDDTLVLSFWVAVPAMTGGGPLIELVDGTTALRLHVDTGHIVATFTSGTTSVDLGSMAAVIDAHFHHVLFTATATSTVITVDGTVVAMSAEHALPRNAALVVGMHDATTPTFFHGAIDELAVLDHAIADDAAARQRAAAVSGELDLVSPLFSWSE